MKNLLSALAISIPMLLAGCGGSDGGSSGVPEARPSGSVSGTAFDGLILNGDVKVYAWNGSKGKLLGQGTTDNAGEYSVRLDQVPSQPVLIEVTSGRYQEEASGRNVALRAGDFLYALKNYQQGDAISTSLTFYTTIAAGLAEHMAGTGVALNEAIARANDTVSDMIGIDIRNVTPLEIVDKSNATPALTDQHLYGFATASISQLTAWISEQNNDDVHKEYNSIKFAAAAYEDIASDGQLDGKDQGRIIAQGTVRLTPDVYRSDIARNMLVMANSDVNVTGLTPGDILPMAQQYNQSNSAMFAGAEIRPLEALSPTITNFSHSNDDVIAGVVEISANVTDTVGLDDVSLFINGTLFEYRGAETAPVWTVDTSTLADGVNAFELYASNITGGETRETISLTVSNAGTTISDVYPEDQSILTGPQVFSAKIADPIGINAVRFILDGASYTLDATETPSREFNVSNMLEGEHELVVAVTNSVGTQTEESVTFTADNTAPELSWNGTSQDVWVKEFPLDATASDNIGLKKTELFIDGDLVNTYADGTVSEVIDSRDYPEGDRDILLRATDKAGNVTELSTKPLFDNTTPSISILSASSGDYYEDIVRFKGIASDAVGIEKVEAKMAGKVLRTLQPESDIEFSSSFRVGRFDNGTGFMTTGPYTLTLIVTDKAGFRSTTSSTVNVKINRPDPDEDWQNMP